MSYRVFCLGSRLKAWAALLLAVWLTPGFAAADPAPKLVLQITVDQLRGDLPERYLKNMGEGGFRYLLKDGIWYADANYSHANTETVVGHTSLATDAYPSEHGMVANVWLDRDSGTLKYNIEDPDYPILSEGAGVVKATEIDPTQKLATSDGRSPLAIETSTFADELAIATDGKAKLFGVSIKDRGAVAMAGHAGKAFWFSKQSGEFVTSQYYYPAYPQWVNDWNAQKLPLAYAGQSWSLLNKPESYLFGAADDQSWETAFPGYGRVFPHEYGPADSPYFNTFLTLSPAGDDLTLSFAKALIVAEDIGKDEVTDYLSISFSSTDYVGHVFGPSSLEAEDNLLRLDRTLADLFAYVDKHVGLKNTLIVLSADHGAPEAPGYLNGLGIPAAYVAQQDWDEVPEIVELKQRLGFRQPLIKEDFHPYLYLNRATILEKGLNQEDVERAVAQVLMSRPEVALAQSSMALQRGAVADSALGRAALHNYNPKRSGDIYLVFKPDHYINEFDGLSVASTHGSPWRYDSFVPVVFAGGQLKGQRVYRPIEPTEIAPTLSALLGIKPPSGARGAPLLEVLQGK